MSKSPRSKLGSADVAIAIVLSAIVVMAAIIVGSLLSMWLKGR